MPESKRELIDVLQPLSVDELKAVYHTFIGAFQGTPKKSVLISEIARRLSFNTETAFQAWFDKLPSLMQQLIRLTFYEGYVPIAPIEKNLGVNLIQRENSWSNRKVFTKKSGISFFPLYKCQDQYCTALPLFLRLIVQPWFPPLTPSLDTCLADEAGAVWDNSKSVADSFPLFCEALRELIDTLPDNEQHKLASRGFKKKTLKSLYQSSGLVPFPPEIAAPDNVELLARFLLLMSNFKPLRPKDGQDSIRSLISAFFSDHSQYPELNPPPDRCLLECAMLLDHFSSLYTFIYSSNAADKLPQSRVVFRDILLRLGKDQRCFDADKLADFIRLSGKEFSVFSPYYEPYLRFNAESICFDKLTYSREEYSNIPFIPEYMLKLPLLIRPLFKAYCYLFAALGILEITQRDPPLVRSWNGKQTAISPYDALATIRVTDFGRWCLDLSSVRPARTVQKYEAIADKELFLVTVRGSSLERKVYLDRIGVKLGKERWRISPASFIAGCSNKSQIEDRIQRFKALIDPKPAPHWTRLFEKALSRAGLFDTSCEGFLIYQLPGDTELTEELLRDPSLKTIAFRAEGQLLLVPKEKERHFFALLAEHGIAHFS